MDRDWASVAETLQVINDHELEVLWAHEQVENRSGPAFILNVKGVEYLLRWIPAGMFVMGSPQNELGHGEDEVEHRVVLSQGFWMGETPCTQALWRAVMGRSDKPFEFEHPQRPVDSISWKRAQTFIRRLEKRQPGLRMRLPTEAQWEYACRAGSRGATYAGSLDILGEYNAPALDGIAWHGGNSGYGYEFRRGWNSSDGHEKQYGHRWAGTRQVKTREQNAWGLYDMLGNVMEWCEDWYGPYELSHFRMDPLGPVDGDQRIMRGGSWDSPVHHVRAAHRAAARPASYRGAHVGFRLSRGL